MFKQFIRHFATIVLCYGGAVAAQSNAINPDTQYVRTFFDKEIKDQSRLYNGREYNFIVGYEGLAYYPTRVFDNNGTIIFDGVLYQNVSLMLDVYQQKVITLLRDQTTKIALATDKVSSFKLHGHQFVNSQIKIANRNDDTISGYFDQLYMGKTKIYVQRSKILQEISSNQTTKKYFIDKNSFFVEKDGKFYRFNSARNLLSFFADKRKLIQRYLREQNVQYKENPESIMVMIATYYDSLN